MNIGYLVAKETKNNKLNNLTININSQHEQHDDVGNICLLQLINDKDEI